MMLRYQENVMQLINNTQSTLDELFHLIDEKSDSCDLNDVYTMMDVSRIVSDIHQALKYQS